MRLSICSSTHLSAVEGTPLRSSSSGTGDRQSASFQSKHIIMPWTAIIISGMWGSRSKEELGRYTVAEVKQRAAHLIFIFYIEMKLKQTVTRRRDGSNHTEADSLLLIVLGSTAHTHKFKVKTCLLLYTHLAWTSPPTCIWTTQVGAFKALWRAPLRPDL